MMKGMVLNGRELTFPEGGSGLPEGWTREFPEGELPQSVEIETELTAGERERIVQEVLKALELPVRCTVKDYDLILSGDDLAAGTYTAYFRKTNGDLIEIGRLVKEA